MYLFVCVVDVLVAVVCWLLIYSFAVCRSLFVVCSLLFAVCCSMLFVVDCLLVVVCLVL